MDESLSFLGLMEFFHHCIPNFAITDRPLYQADRETLPWGPHSPGHYTTPLLLQLWETLPTVPAVALTDYSPRPEKILSPLYRRKFQSGHQGSSPTSWVFKLGLWCFSVQRTRPHCLWVAAMLDSSISSSWTHVTGSQDHHVPVNNGRIHPPQLRPSDSFFFLPPWTLTPPSLYLLFVENLQITWFPALLLTLQLSFLFFLL